MPDGRSAKPHSAQMGGTMTSGLIDEQDAEEYDPPVDPARCRSPSSAGGDRQSLATAAKLRARHLNVSARRNKLRSFDSSFEIFDSERWSFDSRPPSTPPQLISTCLDVPAMYLKLRSFDSELRTNDS
jgi:hypothetical protein